MPEDDRSQEPNREEEGRPDAPQDPQRPGEGDQPGDDDKPLDSSSDFVVRFEKSVFDKALPQIVTNTDGSLEIRVLLPSSAHAKESHHPECDISGKMTKLTIKVIV
jgi:hypothetical protein